MKMEIKLLPVVLKYNLKQEVKTQQGSLLSQTDWVVVRKADNDTAIPSNIATWRAAIRTKATEMETAMTMQQYRCSCSIVCF